MSVTPATPLPPRPHGPFAAMRRLMPPGEVIRFLAVGVWNTVFAYVIYAAFVALYGHLLPHKYILLTPDLATLTAKPLGITMSFLCYKFIVFKTKGNFVREWLKCFAVYGVGMIPELLALPLITKFFLLFPMTGLMHLFHLPHHPAPYLAGIVISIFTAAYSYLAHKKFSFKR